MLSLGEDWLSIMINYMLIVKPDSIFALPVHRPGRIYTPIVNLLIPKLHTHVGTRLGIKCFPIRCLSIGCQIVGIWALGVWELGVLVLGVWVLGVGEFDMGRWVCGGV